MTGSRKPRQSKAPVAIRCEAYELALEAANERESDGDPEGAGAIRDLAERIKAIRLSELR